VKERTRRGKVEGKKRRKGGEGENVQLLCPL